MKKEKEIKDKIIIKCENESKDKDNFKKGVLRGKRKKRKVKGS